MHTTTNVLNAQPKHSTFANFGLQKKHYVSMKNVASIILGGGQGSRLFPLTISRCKPALCYGGRYRLVDIPISNAIHSGCPKIFLITQFLSSSLHHHILSTYRFGNSSSSSIELLSTEEKPHKKVWFQGTADAVRQNLNYFEDTHADYFLILSGDQLYDMDFNHLLDCAKNTGADLVIASLPIRENDAKRMGVMQVDDDNFITAFQEKPEAKSDLNKLLLSKQQRQNFGINESTGHNFLGSMGIYLFKRHALIDLLRSDPREDFGKHLIPNMIETSKVAAYIHRGYWEDIGTIESFYAANMALTSSLPPFNCYNESWPIFTKPMTLPGAKILGASIDHSILCEGTVIEGAQIKNSIIGPRTLVKSGTTICDAYVMGNDFFTPPTANSRMPSQLHIGKNTVISHAIIDRHVCIGNNVKLINKDQLSHYDGENIYIRDGIIIIPHGTFIPDNFSL